MSKRYILFLTGTANFAELEPLRLTFPILINRDLAPDFVSTNIPPCSLASRRSWGGGRTSGNYCRNCIDNWNVNARTERYHMTKRQ